MRRILLYSLICILALAGTAVSGVVNPNISVIGQPSVGLTDDAEEADPNRAHLDIGETEFQFDDYLNPYSRGTIILSLADEGLELEEGFFTIFRGMPAGLNLKAGKYRVGFGKLNTAHRHANPFAKPFRVLSTYLPGEESFNETGISLSERLPAPGDMSLIATVDWLQGNTFRREREGTGGNDPIDSYNSGPDRADETRPAVVGRLSGFMMAGERSGLEFGLSATQGTNNVAAGTRTRIFGADAKAKLWKSAQSYIVLQSELLKLDREDAYWDPEAGAYGYDKVSPVGGYIYADYNFSIRYNVGVSYERFQDDSPERITNQAVGLFAGFALMEETTAFRFDWSHFIPGTPDGAAESPDAVNTFTLRMLFSMGPHKAHQF
jgi:hypothetical protein